MAKKSSGHFRKKALYDLLVTSVILCVMIACSFFGVWEFLNWKLYDKVVNIYRKETQKSEHVSIVCIDQQSLDLAVKNMGYGWPWPRDVYGKVTEYLTGCGAKAVIFDVIFSEPSPEFVYSRGSDADFSQKISDSGIVYLSAAVVQGDTVNVPSNDFDKNKVFVPERPEFRNIELTDYHVATFPVYSLSKGSAGIVFANPVSERDGIFRRYQPLFKLNGKYISSTGFGVVRDIVSENTLNEQFYRYFGKNTLVDQSGKVLLNYYGKDGPDGVFPYYSFFAVLVSAVKSELGDEPLIPSDAFRDKVVIIGSNASGLLDLKYTPFSRTSPGMEIHATAIENFLLNDFIYRLPGWIVFAAIILVTVILFGINAIIRNLRISVPVFTAMVLIEFFSAYILVRSGCWTSIVDVISTTVFVFIGLMISGYFSESKDVRVIRRQFERYVNDAVLDEIMANPSAVALKGRTLVATVMATDIADFTTISEALPPSEVVSRLNDYLSEVSEVLIDNSAFINKYIGDAILAIYGTFEEANHSRHSCRAALAAQEIISRKVAEARSRNETPFITRIGITTGEITLGNIGSMRKIEYTVIGDAVNSAFRLEGLNKFYNTRILVSEHTQKDITDEFEFRQVDVLRYKGKLTPVKIYELLGSKGSVDPVKLRWRDSFEETLGLYQHKQFEEALERFQVLADEGDAVSGVFARRCRGFIEEPPPDDWNGVWIMKRK